MTIYHAVIHTMTEAGTIPHGFLTVENGKITCVQSGDPDTVTEDDLDAKGSLLLPGFIDAHTHLGILEDGLDFEGDDCNECTDPFTPHLRAIDGVNPLDRCFSEALAPVHSTVCLSYHVFHKKKKRFLFLQKIFLHLFFDCPTNSCAASMKIQEE